MNIESERPPYFRRPHARAYTDASSTYRGNYHSYTHYNFLRPGLVAWLKCRRFEAALQLAAPWFHRTPVVDFGCADGVLLPSLSRLFPEVIGIDRDPAVCALARQAANELALPNVQIVCAASTRGMSLSPACRLIFALETLEHACAPDAARIAFMRKLFEPFAPGAEMILSVPRTTGLVFLLKYLAQRVRGIRDEPLTLWEACRAVWGDTRALEPRWQGGHLGFNDRTFRRTLHRSFRVLDTRHTLMSTVYRVAPR